MQTVVAEDLLKALYDGDTIRVKQFFSAKIDNGMDPTLFNSYISESHDLLKKYGVPKKRSFILNDKNDPNLLEVEVPVLNQQQKKMATIQIFFARFLPENEVYSFGIDDEVLAKDTTEAPKEK